MRKLLFEDDVDLLRAISGLFGFDSLSARHVERAHFATAIGAFIVLLALLAELAVHKA
jgi:hypothetical protein